METKKDVPPEPPSCPNSPAALVLIGKNSCGQWVAQEQRGMFGGLFVDCKKAVRFALDENGHRPQSIVVVPGILELDMNRKPAMAPRAAANGGFAMARVA
jgi:hypothetical protein